MNTISMLYKIFKLNNNIGAMERAFTGKYRLGLVGSAQDVAQMRIWLGERTVCARMSGETVSADWGPFRREGLENEEPDAEAVKAWSQQWLDCNVIICHLGVGMPSDQFLRRLGAAFPSVAQVLYICEPGEAELPLPMDVALPTVWPLRGNSRDRAFAGVVFAALPNFCMMLSRDHEHLRDVAIDALIKKNSFNLACVAAASSVTVTMPVVGQLVGLLAVSAETLALTLGQMRLCILIGGLYGRSLNFFDRMDELWPVVGGAWGWRQLAREAVGLIPGAGVVAKALVAWSGTYVVGRAAEKLYAFGECSPEDVAALRLEAGALAKEAVTLDKVLEHRPGEPQQ